MRQARAAAKAHPLASVQRLSNGGDCGGLAPLRKAARGPWSHRVSQLNAAEQQAWGLQPPFFLHKQLLHYKQALAKLCLFARHLPD